MLTIPQGFEQGRLQPGDECHELFHLKSSFISISEMLAHIMNIVCFFKNPASFKLVDIQKAVHI